MNLSGRLLPLAALCAGHKREELMLTKVYRSGVVKAPRTRGIEARSFLQADNVRPIGRQGRETAIFASPDLNGVATWFYRKSMMQGGDPFVREITVDSDSVYIYSVAAWNETHWNRASYDSYWESGITLTSYQTSAKRKSGDSNRWEILLGAADVLAVREVPDEEFLEACRSSFAQYPDLAHNLRSLRSSLVRA
jgi:hypothetical protein